MLNKLAFKSREAVTHLATCVSIPGAEQITLLTKTNSFKANAVSRAMDLTNGGYLKYGGLHRLYGGHSACDVTLWKKFGGSYGVELCKDSLTTYGLPLPGVETFATKTKLIAPSTIQKWGTTTASGLLGALIASADSAVSAYKVMKSDSHDVRISPWQVAKCGLKLAVGACQTNPVYIVTGLVDASILLQSKIKRESRFNYEPWSAFTA